METKKVPAIISDIDGVLAHWPYPTLRTPDAINFIRQPLKELDPTNFADEDTRLPFVLLTNGGGCTEEEKIHDVNEILGLKRGVQFNADEIVLCHSPLKSIIRENYQDRLILVSGYKDLHSTMKSCNVEKYILIDEYCSLYPSLVPFGSYPREPNPELVSKIQKRLGFENTDFLKEPLQVHAIFLLADPFKWEENIQVILDLLSTPDGKIAKTMPTIGPETHIPIYSCSNDQFSRLSFRLPRIVFGAFNDTLKMLYKQVYQRDMELRFVCKPEKITFDYAKQLALKNTKYEISKFYMIGDNPNADIKGANQAGWESILVRTGVFQGAENDPTNPAKYVVDDFYEAIKLICKLENISCPL